MLSNWQKGLMIAAVSAAGTAAILGPRLRAAGIPATNSLTYSGTLSKADGQPENGPHSILVYFWDTATGGVTPLCQTLPAATQTAVTNGRFTVALPDSCTQVIKANPDLYVEVTVDGSPVGRTKLGAVPYAMEANHAVSADRASAADRAAAADKATASSELANSIAGVTARTGALESTFSRASFVAYNDSPDRYQSTTGKWPGNAVVFNNGAVWSTTNYEFTAPVAGYYSFSWSAFSLVASGRTFLRKNTTDQMQTDANGKPFTMILELAAGDKVSLGGTANYPMTWYGAFAHNAFSGYLISAKQ
ncbi:MAG: C1q-like domain-containing protein [Myxococcales bacterium]